MSGEQVEEREWDREWEWEAGMELTWVSAHRGV